MLNNSKKEDRKKMMSLVLLGVLSLLLCALIVSAPPTPHNIFGQVFHSDGSTAADVGTPVRINNTNQSGGITDTQVTGAPIGLYSAVLTANDNDTIIGYSWNATHYGTNTTNLSPTTTRLNIVIQFQRPPEINVTILAPPDSSFYEVDDTFLIRANISALGGIDGLNCNATVTFTDPSIINLTSGNNATNLVGDLSIGSHVVTVWNATARAPGTVNFTVRSQCQNSGLNFDQANVDTVTNLLVNDTTPPVVTLISPDNASILTVSSGNEREVEFSFNVTDASTIFNCSLILNDQINLTNTTIARNTPQSFIQNLSVGAYNWSVVCVDNTSALNTGYSLNRSLEIVFNQPPQIQAINLPSEVNLQLGGSARVECNATIYEINNISDIAVVNATLFQESVGHTAADDNNNHYTNASCFAVGNATFTSNYTCSFGLEYYANNGTWMCNLTVADKQGQSVHANTTSQVNELIAIQITPSVLDYGALEATETSPTDTNLTLLNVGNVDFNVSVEGYAENPGDETAMICNDGNITIGNQRFAVNSSLSFDQMINLSSNTQTIANLSLFQRTQDLHFGTSRNETYWKLAVPGAVKGSCNGTILFRTVII